MYGISLDHPYFAKEEIKAAKGVFICEYCKRIFHRQNSLYLHVKRSHGSLSSGDKRCLDCEESFSNISSLRSHLTQVHSIAMSSSKMNFDSISDFELWREKYEEENHVKFYRQRTRGVNGKHEVVFGCSQSGVFKCKNTGKRKLKAVGSRKSGNHCTASISCRQKLGDSKITATMCLTHYGHNIDDTNFGISKGLRQKVFGKLLEGATMQDILEDVTFQGSNLSKRDIKNITMSFRTQLKRSELVSLSDELKKCDYDLGNHIQTVLKKESIPEVINGLTLFVGETEVAKEAEIELEIGEINSKSNFEHERESMIEACEELMTTVGTTTLSSNKVNSFNRLMKTLNLILKVDDSEKVVENIIFA